MTMKKITNPIDKAKEAFIKRWEVWNSKMKSNDKRDSALYRMIMFLVCGDCLDKRMEVSYDMLEMALCEMCVSEPRHESVAYLSLDDILTELAQARMCG